MQPQTLAINSIIAFIKTKFGFSLSIDALPENGGISVEIMPGQSGTPSLDKQSQFRTIPLLFLSKFKEQQTAYDKLLLIGNLLSTTKFSAVHFSVDVQILTADIKTETALVGKEGDYWIYSMIADIKIYFRKD